MALQPESLALQQWVRTSRLVVDVIPEAVAIDRTPEPVFDPATDLHQAELAACGGQFEDEGVTDELIRAPLEDCCRPVILAGRPIRYGWEGRRK